MVKLFMLKVTTATISINSVPYLTTVEAAYMAAKGIALDEQYIKGIKFTARVPQNIKLKLKEVIASFVNISL